MWGYRKHQHNRSYIWKTTASVILNGELDAITLRSAMRQGCPVFHQGDSGHGLQGFGQCFCNKMLEMVRPLSSACFGRKVDLRRTWREGTSLPLRTTIKVNVCKFSLLQAVSNPLPQPPLPYQDGKNNSKLQTDN